LQGILRFIIDNFVTVAGAAILTVFTARIIFNIKIDAKSLFCIQHPLSLFQEQLLQLQIMVWRSFLPALQ